MPARQHDRSRPRLAGEAWRAVLAGRPAHQVLEALLEGDPLDLRGRVARALERRVLALDAERAQLRAAARIARLAGGYRGHPAPDTWLDERVDEALFELVREDLEDERDGNPGAPPPPCVAGALGLGPAATRRVLTTFNRLPLADRRAFYELVVRGGDFDALGRRAVAVARRARAVWIELLRAEHLTPLPALRPVQSRGAREDVVP